MIRLVTEIQAGEKVRENLIALIGEIKNEDNEVSKDLLSERGQWLPGLLKHADPKVRKNAAKLMGLFPADGFAEELFQAYCHEGTLFVRPAYLEALKEYDIAPYREELLRQKAEVMEMTINPLNAKHIDAEIKALVSLLGVDKVYHHSFTEYPISCDVILAAEPMAKEVLYEQLEADKKKIVGPGVFVRTNHPKELFRNRLFREMLFPIPGLQCVSGNPYGAAGELYRANLLPFIRRILPGSGAYGYRVSMRTQADSDKKSSFIKIFTGELYRLSGGMLLNSPGDYEIEIRLIARATGDYRVLLRFYNLKDERFLYRRETVAASIHPVDAAVCMELAAPYLKEHAQVLDPFCGVGTMLVERHKRVPMGTAYAVDTFSEAIDKAKRNLRKAELRCNLIHRNFLDFRHEYLFDEIVTNVPFASRPEDRENVLELLRKFFKKAETHLKPGGILCVYTRDGECCRQYAKDNGLVLLKSYRMQEKEGTDWLIFQAR